MILPPTADYDGMDSRAVEAHTPVVRGGTNSRAGQGREGKGKRVLPLRKP